MAVLYTREQIERVIRPAEVIAEMETAFVAYSRGEAVIPPVGQMEFENPPGDCHIKYGYLKGGETFTIKIATGFWKNPDQGLPSSNGVVLIFSSRTGELLTILQDEGYLTDVRTAAAGAVAAKYLAPPNVECIGMIGAGTQAKLKLEYLKEVTPCRRVLLWARSRERAHSFQVEGFGIEVASGVKALAQEARLIVTTTSSQEWLIGVADVRPGTHITAVGADGGGKQELEPRLFAVSVLCAADSRVQCSQFGDSFYAIQQNWIRAENLIELGTLIANPAIRRRSATDITIADLTGVAVQDIAIAELALGRLREGSRPRDDGTEAH
jgi:ornithine cyclodeaminase